MNTAEESQRSELPPAAMVKMLSPTEAAQLAYHEAHVASGLRAFIKVARSLLAIRQDRLYRVHYETFEEYCEVRWGFSVRRAQQLLSAEKMVREMADANPGSPFVIPASEKHLRPLFSLPPEKRREAWNEVVESAPGGNVTIKHAQTVVDRLRGAPGKPEQIAAAVNAAIADTRKVLDLIGTADSVQATAVANALQKLDAFKLHLERMQKLDASRPKHVWPNRLAITQPQAAA